MKKDGDLVPCPGCFISGGRAPDTHKIGSWVGRRVGLHWDGEERSPGPYREWNLSRPAVLTQLSWLLLLLFYLTTKQN